MRYVLSGEVGCKKNCNKFNSVTRRVYKTAHFRNWHDSALLQLKSQGVPAVPVGRFRIEITLYHGTFRDVAFPKVPKRAKAFWTPEEIDRILDNAPTPEFRLFWSLMAFAGLRHAEACSFGPICSWVFFV